MVNVAHVHMCVNVPHVCMCVSCCWPLCVVACLCHLRMGCTNQTWSAWACCKTNGWRAHITQHACVGRSQTSVIPSCFNDCPDLPPNHNAPTVLSSTSQTRHCISTSVIAECHQSCAYHHKNLNRIRNNSLELCTSIFEFHAKCSRSGFR